MGPGGVRICRIAPAKILHGVAGQRCEEQQGDDVGDLDHRVHRRAGGVLVRVTHGIAGHRRLVRVGALAAMVALFNILLRVIPRATTRGHGNRNEQARHDRPQQHRPQ